MTDTLFPLPESPSPKLAWMLEHGVSAFHAEGLSLDEQPWTALIGTWEDIMEKGIEKSQNAALWQPGQTEIEALQRLAQKQGWKLWNEPV